MKGTITITMKQITSLFIKITCASLTSITHKDVNNSELLSFGFPIFGHSDCSSRTREIQTYNVRNLITRVKRTLVGVGASPWIPEEGDQELALAKA